MPPIRTALLGYGFAGETFHAPLITTAPGLELVLVGSRSADKVNGRYPDLRVVADPIAAASDSDVDLVVIATPNDTHAPLARAALEAGKHVVVDKPFTLTLAEARELTALAEARTRTLAVFHNRRWDSDFLTVRHAVATGVFGRPVLIESRFDRFRPQVRDRWREGTGPGAGILYDLGPHLIDQMLVLFGPPDDLGAEIGTQRPGGHADDWFRLTLRWGETRAMLSAGMLVGGGTSRWLVHATNGTLLKRRLDIQEDQLRAGMIPGAAGWGEDPDPAELLAGDTAPVIIPPTPGDQRAFYAAIAAAIGEGAPNPIPPAQAATVMALLEVAREAARSGRRVAPDLTPAERAAWAPGVALLGKGGAAL